MVIRRLRARFRPSRRRLHHAAGVTIIELVAGMAIAMVGFALVSTVLVTAQRQERLTTDTARTVDEARLALSLLANEVREARSLTQNGADAVAWFDLDRDGLQDDGEAHVYGFRPDGATSMLVREIDGDRQVLLGGLSAGSLMASIQRTGFQLSMSVTLPAGDDGRGGITLTSKAVNRGNG